MSSKKAGKTPSLAPSKGFHPHAPVQSHGEDNEYVYDSDGNPIPTTMVIPPDGGWGWMILIASFLCNMMTDGNLYAFGMYMKVIPKDFGHSHGTVSLVASLLQGFNLFVGPLVSALANKHGFRVVTVCGSVVACFGFALSYYADSIIFLCFSYGVIGGIGIGMVGLPTSIVIGFYFERWRALATCISTCGSSIGASIIPPVVELCIRVYGWRISMLMQAALMLSCSLFATLLRPLEPVPIEDFIEMLSVTSGNIGKRSGRRRANVSLKTKSTDSFLVNKYSYTTVRQMSTANGSESLPLLRDDSQTSLESDLKASRKAIRFLGPRNNECPTVAQAMSWSTLASNREQCVFQVDDRTPSERFTQSLPGSDIGTGRKKKIRFSRPMYRDDILYAANLTRLPKYQSHHSTATYNMSVTHLPSRKDIEEEESPGFICFPEAMKRTLATMLDLSLLRSPSFLLLTLSVCIKGAVVYVPSIFLPDRAIQTGVDPTITLFLITMISLTSMVSRIICGILMSYFNNVNTVAINNISMTIAGIATIVIGFFVTAEADIIYCVIFGLCIGCFSSLHTLIMVEMLGLERLTNAFGLSSLFQGMAMMVGPPIAGWLKMVISYGAAFWFAGTLLCISATLLLPLNWINAREKENQRAKRHHREFNFNDPE